MRWWNIAERSDADAATRGQAQSGLYRRTGKRVLDLSLVLLLSPVWLPVMALTAFAVRWRLGSPVLFRQIRPGRREVAFTLMKFRTMTDARGGTGELLPDAERLTAFGRWLRRTSLDELPELFNVLRGDMSLVGPRPLLVEYLDRYSAEQRRRHDVPPGITGWAQVNGRNAISWPEKFARDIWYVEHQSLALDIRILLRTVARTIGREGINQPGSATAEAFRGEQGDDRPGGAAGPRTTTTHPPRSSAECSGLESGPVHVSDRS